MSWRRRLLVVTCATALQLSMAETEPILQHFTRHNVHHPIYRALAELRKALTTILLCRCLPSQALRGEDQCRIECGQPRNSTNAFIFQPPPL